MTDAERAFAEALIERLYDERLSILDATHRNATTTARRSAVIRADECARIAATVRDIMENGDGEAVAPMILKEAAARLEATVPERTEDDEQVGFEKAIAAIRALSEDQP